MKAWTRWQDWTTLIGGVALILAPWVFGLVSTTAFALDAWFIGVLAAAFALFSLARPGRFVTEGVILLLGVWLFFSPWLLGFSTVSVAMGIAWIIGLLFVVTAGWTVGETRRFHAGVPT
jgi:hypothetical protein